MVDKSKCLKILKDNYLESLKEFYNEEKSIKVMYDIMEKVDASKLPKLYSIKKSDTRLKEKIIISYLTNLFEQSTLSLLLKNIGKNKWEIAANFVSNIENIDEFELQVGYELYLRNVYQSETQHKVLSAGEYSFNHFIKDRLHRIYKWKVNRSSGAKEFPYWTELQKKDKKDYLTKLIKLDCQILLNQMSEESFIGKSPVNNDSNYRISVIQDQGVDFSIRKQSNSVATANEDIRLDLQKTSENFPELANYNDFQLFYNVTENDKFRVTQYYYINQMEQSSIKGNPKIFSTFDQKVITALVRMSEKVLVDNTASGTIREILKEIYDGEDTNNFNKAQYKAVYDSCLKIDNYKISVFNKQTGAYKPYQIASIEIKKLDENEGSDVQESYGNMLIIAKFHPTYIEIIQNSVFIDGKLEKSVGSNNMAYSLLGPLQKLRYEAYIKGLIGEEQYLDYYSFFRVVLVLSLRKKHDMQLLDEALNCIKDSHMVIKGLRKENNGFYVEWVPIDEKELENIRNGIKRFSSSGGQFKLYNNILTET